MGHDLKLFIKENARTTIKNENVPPRVTQYRDDASQQRFIWLQLIFSAEECGLYCIGA